MDAGSGEGDGAFGFAGDDDMTAGGGGLGIGLGGVVTGEDGFSCAGGGFIAFSIRGAGGVSIASAEGLELLPGSGADFGFPAVLVSSS